MPAFERIERSGYGNARISTARGIPPIELVEKLERNGKKYVVESINHFPELTGRGLTGAERLAAYGQMTGEERRTRATYLGALQLLRTYFPREEAPPGEMLTTKQDLLAQTAEKRDMFLIGFVIRKETDAKPLLMATAEVSEAGGTGLLGYLAGAEASRRTYRETAEKNLQEKMRLGKISGLSREEFERTERANIADVEKRMFSEHADETGRVAGTFIASIKKHLAERYPNVIWTAETERVAPGTKLTEDQRRRLPFFTYFRVVTPTVNGKPLGYFDSWTPSERYDLHMAVNPETANLNAQKLENLVYSLSKNHYGIESERKARSIAGRTVWGGPLWRAKKFWTTKVIRREPEIGFTNPKNLLAWADAPRPWWRRVLGLTGKPAQVVTPAMNQAKAA